MKMKKEVENYISNLSYDEREAFYENIERGLDEGEFMKIDVENWDLKMVKSILLDLI